MGQYRTYRDTSVERELARIERELIAYKSKQLYGIRQIKSRTCATSKYNSSVGTYGTHCIAGIITFEGVNKNKLARGGLYCETAAEDSRLDEYIYSYVSVSDSSDGVNLMRWSVYVECSNLPDPFSGGNGLPTTGPFTVIFKVAANMEGVVRFEPV